jgi:hypothetical protein
MTDFVLHSAEAAAERTIERRAMLILTAQETEAFADTILNPRSPGPVLRRAARAFYLHHEFVPLQDHPHRLFLAIAQLKKPSSLPENFGSKRTSPGARINPHGNSRHSKSGSARYDDFNEDRRSCRSRWSIPEIPCP